MTKLQKANLQLRTRFPGALADQAAAGRELAEAVLDYTADPTKVYKLLQIDNLALEVLGPERSTDGRSKKTD